MERLSRRLEGLSLEKTNPYPEKVIQFGEGNFLRGFVDWMIHQAHQANVYDGSVVVVQPISRGLVSLLNEQDGLYTMILRGQENGKEIIKTELVQSISRGINSYEEWDQVLECARNPQIEILVSNTTEAGISYSDSDRLGDRPPESFPGKVCSYLYHRFQAFNGDPSRGMLIIPCELIDRNGDNLKAIVLRLAREWGQSPQFLEWIEEANIFANSLVDRIVTGYPGKDNAQELWKEFRYEDQLVDTGEYFHLWVIEAPESAADRFPLHKAGLNVKWVRDLTPYRTRKVRILNGAHTSLFALAHLAEFASVKEAVEDKVLGQFLHTVIFDEIIPTLDLDKEELEEYADQVIERFKNPFIHHRWLDISLNSVSKYKARVLPSLQNYLERGTVPKYLTLSVAALIAFYGGHTLTDAGLAAYANGKEYTVRDDRSNLEFFYETWKTHGNDYIALTNQVLANTKMWGVDLTKYKEFSAEVAKRLKSIRDNGVLKTIKDLG